MLMTPKLPMNQSILLMKGLNIIIITMVAIITMPLAVKDNQMFIGKKQGLRQKLLIKICFNNNDGRVYNRHINLG